MIREPPEPRSEESQEVVIKRQLFLLRVVSAGAIAYACMVHEAHAQAAACFSGARAAAEAYVVSNPIYATVLTDFEQYVANHHNFALMETRSGVSLPSRPPSCGPLSRSYNPAEQQRRDAINTELESVGLGRGRPQSTASGDAHGVAAARSSGSGITSRCER